MMTERELDRILTSWMTEGGDRAPLADVEAALEQVRTVAQRRRSGVRRLVRMGSSRRWALVAALLLLAIAAAIGVGSGSIRLPWNQPAPVPPALQPMHIEDWSVEVSIPKGWSEVGPAHSEYRHFAGTTPEGHLSASHESPFAVTVCVPDCRTIQVTETIPYSATAQLGSLRAGAEAIAGNQAWSTIPIGILPELVNGGRLDSTAQDGSGRPWRRVLIVGLRDRNAVAIAWSQPSEAFDEILFERVLAGIELPSAPVYSDGDLIVHTDDEFVMPIPGVWNFVDQPAVDGRSISGLRRFAGGRVVVSIGTEHGAFGWCDPACHVVPDQTSLDALDTTIRSGQVRGGGVTAAITLGGESGRMIYTDPDRGRRYVIAMQGSRPVGVVLDPGDYEVEPGTFEQMIAGFQFLDPVIDTPAHVFTTADGHAELGLSADWNQSAHDQGRFMKSEYVLSVRVGDGVGTIVPCDDPAGPWERCESVQARTLNDLAAAVQPAPIADHGVGPPNARLTDSTLDGEPSVVIRIQAYEYAARGGQELAYVVAMHGGRPYILRMWTSRNELQGLDSVISNFRFLD